MSDIATAYVRIRPDTASFKAEAEKGIKGAFRGIGKLTVATLGVAGIAEATKAVVSAAAVQQVQLAELRKSVENVNAAWVFHGKTVTEILESNARKTGFTVADLSSSFSRAVTATQSTSKAFRILADAEDLARTGNLSLSQATLVLDRAYQGSAQSLRRYGIVIPKITEAQDLLTKSHENSIATGAKFSASQKLIYKNALDLAKARDKLASSTNVLDVVEQKFGGQAAVFARTTEGQLARLKETLNQFEVGIGTQILPTINHALSGLQHWVDGLRTSTAIHNSVAAGVVAVKSAFEGVATVLRVVGPVVSSVATATASLIQTVGGGGLLAIAIGYKAIGAAAGIAAIVEKKYAEILASGTVANTASAASTAANAKGIGILGAAATKNAVVWDENTGAVSTYTVAQIKATVAAEAATKVTQAQTAALLEEAAAYKVTGVAAFGGGNMVRNANGQFVTSTREIEKMSGASSKFSTIARGAFASVGGWATVAQIGVAALAFGIYKLVSADTALESANKRVLASQQALDRARQTSLNIQNQIAGLKEAIPHDKEAVASSKIAVDRAKAALASTTAARGSVEYRDAVHQVVSAVLFERDAVKQLGKDQDDLEKKTSAGRYARNQEAKTLVEAAKRYRELGDAQATAAAAELLRSRTAPGRIGVPAPTAARVAEASAEAQKRAAKKFIDAVVADSEQAHSKIAKHNDLLLAQLTRQLGKVPKEQVIRFILKNENPNANLKGIQLGLRETQAKGNADAQKRARDLGHSIVGGAVLGVQDKSALLGQAMVQMMKDAFKATKTFIAGNSPSVKARTELGQSIGDGVAEGIKDRHGAVSDALVSVVDAAIKNAVQHASNALGGGSTGNPSSAAGAPPIRRATGGTVGGSGSGDTVPAMLTPGEVILNRGQQKKMFNRLGMPDQGPHALFRVAQGFADGGVADWRGAAHQGGVGMSRFDKWLHGWLLGKQGLSGAGKDLATGFDPRSKAGLANIASLFVGPRGPLGAKLESSPERLARLQTQLKQPGLLSPKEKAALRTYVSGGMGDVDPFMIMNTVLRGQVPEPWMLEGLAEEQHTSIANLVARLKSKSLNLEKGLSKASLPRSILALRGVSMETLSSLFPGLPREALHGIRQSEGGRYRRVSDSEYRAVAKELQRYRGTVVKDEGFMSASIDAREARGYGEALSVIRARKGDQAVHVGSAFPRIRPGETQLVFNRGQQLRLLGAEVGTQPGGFYADPRPIHPELRLLFETVPRKRFAEGGVADWRGAAHKAPEGSGLSRFDKWVHGWLFGKQGLSGAGKDLAKGFDPRSKEGLVNIASLFAGPKMEFAWKNEGERGLPEWMNARTRSVTASRDGQNLGRLSIVQKEKGWEVLNALVLPQFKRQGIGTAMFREAEKKVGLGNLKHSELLTDEGKLFASAVKPLKPPAPKTRTIFDEPHADARIENLEDELFLAKKHKRWGEDAANVGFRALDDASRADALPLIVARNAKGELSGLGTYNIEAGFRSGIAEGGTAAGVGGGGLQVIKRMLQHVAREKMGLKFGAAPTGIPLYKKLGMDVKMLEDGNGYGEVFLSREQVAMLAKDLRALVRKHAGGGVIRGFASGGIGDSVPAMLTPGEVVLNRKQQGNVAGMLGMGGGGVSPEALFNRIQGFASGGVAGTTFGVDSSPEVAKLNTLAAQTEAKIARLLSFDAGKLHIASGRIADQMGSLADTIKASVQTIKDTIISAKQNLNSIGGSLANDISTLLAKVAKDGTGGAAPTGPVAERLKALNKEIATGVASPELVRKAQALSNQLAAQQTAKAAKEQKGGTQSEIITRKIADTTDLLNKGAIGIEAFDRRINSILKAAGVTPGKARKELGIAFADQLSADIKGLTLQAKAILASPNFGGAGLAPQIIKPLDQIKIEQKNIADAAKSQRDQMIAEQQNAVSEAKKHTALLKKIAAKKAADAGIKDVIGVLRRLGFSEKEIQGLLHSKSAAGNRHNH